MQRNWHILSCEASHFSSCVVWAIFGYAPLGLGHTDLREACAAGGPVLHHSAAPTAQGAHQGQEGPVEWESQALKTPENTPLPQERASESGDWCKGLNHHRSPQMRVSRWTWGVQTEGETKIPGWTLTVSTDISFTWVHLPTMASLTHHLGISTFFFHYLPSLQTSCWSLSEVNQVITTLITQFRCFSFNCDVSHFLMETTMFNKRLKTAGHFAGQTHTGITALLRPFCFSD